MSNKNCFCFSKKLVHHFVPSTKSGIERITDPSTNKGSAFTIKERQVLNIHGLLQPRVLIQEEQLEMCLAFFTKIEDTLVKYSYLTSLLTQNESLFYAFVRKYPSLTIPVIYTPGVGVACLNFGLLSSRPKGMYFTFKDTGRIADIMRNWPERDVRVVVVTDGERILGLGDLGADGMGISIGKLTLYTAFAGLPPHLGMAVSLDLGTKKQHYETPFYTGLKMDRIEDEKYYPFFDEFIRAIVNHFGRTCLIHFEDIGNSHAFQLLKYYQEDYNCFNDDIQGAGAVVIAGFIAYGRISKRKNTDNIFVLFGAGECNLGIAFLLIDLMVQEGISKEKALAKIYVMDSKGLITKSRTDLTEQKYKFAQDVPYLANLNEVVKMYKPTVLIGASTKRSAFTKEIIEIMAENTERPLIFALSNPTDKMECTAEEAYTYSKGKCVFASGSPTPPFSYEGKTFYSGQANNCFLYPGVGLAAVSGRFLKIPGEFFIQAAKCLAKMVTEEDLEKGSLYPTKNLILDGPMEIACELLDNAYKLGIAMEMPEPKNKKLFLEKFVYRTDYISAVPPMYKWD